MYFGKDLNELTTRFASIPNGLDVVNIGSGPSYYDFDWTAIDGVKGYNMAVAPEDFRYDARIIMQYGNYLKECGIVVVVVVCPLSFGKNKYLYKYSFSEKYVSILPKNFVDLPGWKYDLYHACPTLLKIKRLLSHIGSSVVKRLYRFLGVMQTADPISELINGWLLENEYLKNFDDEEQAVYYLDTFREKGRDLRAVLTNCRQQGLRPVIVLPPLSENLRQNISDSFICRFVYDNLREEVTDGTPILDYIDDVRFKDSSNYINGLFLTSQGRKVFTRVVWEDIGKVLLQ